MISAFCYSYALAAEGFLAFDLTYPYRNFVIPFISTGTVFLGVASVSYSKKNKH
jgi:hypothetical protein